VHVPHTWNTDIETEKYRGFAWYERNLEAPAGWEGKCVRLKFDAIYRDAVVWVNGKQAFKHRGSGYTTFYVDLTNFLSYGNTNRIVVQVSNNYSEDALPYKEAFDWADDGGIYRPASIIVTGNPTIEYLHVTATPHLKDGTGKQDSINGHVSVRAKFLETTLGGSMQEADFYVQVVSKRAGQVVFETSEHASILHGEWKLEFAMQKIDLWHFDRPNLYEIKVSVSNAEEKSDELSSRFGFREIKAVGNEILLNGESVRLMGVEWMPGSNPNMGMAENDEQIVRSLSAMKNANCIFTRFHWQQDERVIDWCDEHGILLQEDVPIWGQPWEPGEDKSELAEYQLKSMIQRDYNHPSIICWGTGNELNGQSKQTIAFIRSLREYARNFDTTRFVNYVSNSAQRGLADDATAQGDLMMWNEYVETWCRLQPEDLPKMLDELHQTGPDPEKPLVISEWGMCEPEFTGGDPRRIELMLRSAEAYKNRPYITGAIYFSYNDYRTQMGEDGEGRFRQRIHGVADIYDVPKPSYYVLREVCSPLKIMGYSRSGTDRIRIELAASDTLPRYTLEGYKVILSEWELELPTIRPGETITVELDCPHGEGMITILRPTGFVVAQSKINV
jgi:beta-glucuronidase